MNDSVQSWLMPFRCHAAIGVYTKAVYELLWRAFANNTYYTKTCMHELRNTTHVHAGCLWLGAQSPSIPTSLSMQLRASTSHVQLRNSTYTINALRSHAEDAWEELHGTSHSFGSAA